MPERVLESCRRRLNSRCGGLLDIWDRVGFIHRTARDFLATQRMKDYLRDRVGGGHYNTELARVKIEAYLFRCLLAVTVIPGSQVVDCKNIVDCLYYYCVKAARAGFNEDEEYGLLLLSTFTDTLEDRAIKNPASVRACFLQVEPQRQKEETPESTTSTDRTLPEYGFIGPHLYHILFENGFDKLIVPLLKKDPFFFRNMPISPLAVPIYSPKLIGPYVNIRVSLLKAGYDVSQPVGQSAAWRCFISEYLAFQHNKWRAMIFKPVDGVSLIIRYLEMGASRTQIIEPLRLLHWDAVTYLPLLPLTHIILDLILVDGEWKEAADGFAKVVDAFLSGTDLETTIQLEELIYKLPCLLPSLVAATAAKYKDFSLLSKMRESASIKKAAFEVIIEKGNSVGADMQCLVPVILGCFEHDEGESIVSLMSKGLRQDVSHSGKEEHILTKPGQTFPTQVSVKAPKRQLQGQRGDAEDSPRRVKRSRTQSSLPNRKSSKADDSCIEVIEISD